MQRTGFLLNTPLILMKYNFSILRPDDPPLERAAKTHWYWHLRDGIGSFEMFLLRTFAFDMNELQSTADAVHRQLLRCVLETFSYSKRTFHRYVQHLRRSNAALFDSTPIGRTAVSIVNDMHQMPELRDMYTDKELAMVALHTAFKVHEVSPACTTDSDDEHRKRRRRNCEKKRKHFQNNETLQLAMSRAVTVTKDGAVEAATCAPSHRGGPSRGSRQRVLTSIGKKLLICVEVQTVLPSGTFVALSAASRPVDLALFNRQYCQDSMRLQRISITKTCCQKALCQGQDANQALSWTRPSVAPRQCP